MKLKDYIKERNRIRKCRHKNTVLLVRKHYGFDGDRTWEDRLYFCKDCYKKYWDDWCGRVTQEEFSDISVGTVFEERANEKIK
ncbi:MAG: hypothetical protein LBV67_06225 [Streptococcaceae bacterium]|jgi:hypothetical protein|nr:hypothetical protein [Streptococcaceae bacterium]